MKLADLLALGANSRNDTIWNCLQDGQRLAALSADGRRRAARLYDVLEQAYALQGRMPLRRWVESAWLNLGGPATLETRAEGGAEANFITWPKPDGPPTCVMPAGFLNCWMNWTRAATCAAWMSS